MQAGRCFAGLFAIFNAMWALSTNVIALILTSRVVGRMRFPVSFVDGVFGMWYYLAKEIFF